ncbi:unannotated protein [freshwater metagenome]|uniref:Unannotated protein n=1 Tax=freshwater metagenome TaxID=449393 RepID=A0A6J6Y9N2_9ZZZZ|nr:DUF4191 family protein [Actinomycetota bacterium]MSW16299.1 DUF4191 family protein [Actinomycetota bacterium]MSX44651.1 DUF4191 family protein [Actinomycetota bacterium]MSX85432.1 DUF4191 family protein [Actinomycetota bacterium]MSZ00094.1 DUF4191 family protein [Actinomycetota bacterium]
MALFNRKKKSADAAPVEKKIRFKEIRDAYSITKKEKPLILLYCIAIFIPVWVVGILIGIALDHPYYLGFVTFPIALLAAFFFFTRQAGSAAYASIEGQIGAGASVLMAIRKGWTVTPAVAVTKNQDMVHRAVGKPGVVLVGEGSSAIKHMLTDEKRKVERFAPGVPVFELIVGESDGQVPIRKLQKRMKKFPKKLSTVQLRELRARMKAIGGMNIPIPKGPMPKNVRMPKR